MAALFVKSPLLSTHRKNGVRHGFFTRQGGVSTGLYDSLNAGLGSNDVREHVVENRARICEALGVQSDQLATPHQIHSNHVHIQQAYIMPERPQADGIVTNQQNLAIGVVSADCGPVLFSDAKNGVIGAAHAGWRGAFDGVLEQTIGKMEQLGAERSAIVASLGPTISQRNYEVGPEFYQTFLDRDKAYAIFFCASEKDSHFLFDLHAFIGHQLDQSGVQSEILGICTYANEAQYFSYRRTNHRQEPDYGRQLSAICMEPHSID